MRTACGTRYPTENYVGLPLMFRYSEGGRIPLTIRDVASVPGPSTTTFYFKLLLQYNGSNDGLMASFVSWDFFLAFSKIEIPPRLFPEFIRP